MMKLLSYFMIFASGIIMLSGCQHKQAKDSQTIRNLISAFGNEVNASAQYSAFASRAKDDNYLQIANLFNAVAKSENIHSRNHKAVLAKMGITPEDVASNFEIRSTRENLQISIEGETRETSAIYIEFIAVAEQEGFTDAKKSFIWAKDAEMKHTGYYTAAFAALDRNRLSSLADSFLVCPICGQTFELRQHDEKCSSCRNPKVNFISFP
jgi:rubrerythrin